MNKLIDELINIKTILKYDTTGDWIIYNKKYFKNDKRTMKYKNLIKCNDELLYNIIEDNLNNRNIVFYINLILKKNELEYLLNSSGASP